MANYRKIARRKARKYGLNPRIFVRQISQESGFRPHVVSPAGARGIAQIMPATARGWGVNPDNPRQALDAAARNMANYVRRYGSYENALRAYNAGPGNIRRSHGFSETNRYVANILGGHDPGRLTRSGRGGGYARMGFAPRSTRLPGWLKANVGTRTVFDQAAYETAQRRSRVASYLKQQGRGNSILFRSGLLSTEAPDPADFTSTSLTSSLSRGRPLTIGGSLPRARGGQFRSGRVSISPTADRAGVSTKKPVIRFVRQIAGLMGRRLTIGTGTNHSRMTVNGNVSAHWTGRAADVPLTGAALIKAGQDALIAAGMSPRKARRLTGGLYNVGKWQIIFNTHIGGDHTNHLHVGQRG